MGFVSATCTRALTARLTLRPDDPRRVAAVGCWAGTIRAEGGSSLVIHFGSLSSVHVCVFVVESVRYYYLAVSHYTARVYCTSWHEAMRRTPPTLARVSSESPANLAGVSSESLTTLARVSSARSRSPCTHGDCSLLLPSGEPLAIRHTSVQHSRTGQGGWVSILQVPSCFPPAGRAAWCDFDFLERPPRALRACL